MIWILSGQSLESNVSRKKRIYKKAEERQSSMRVEGNHTLLGVAEDSAEEQRVVGISLAQKKLGCPVVTTLLPLFLM